MERISRSQRVLGCWVFIGDRLGGGPLTATALGNHWRGQKMRCGRLHLSSLMLSIAPPRKG